MNLPVGAEIDGWRVERRIGQGSMGTVFEARRAGVRAALKVIRPDASDAEQMARFRREARVLMEIEHPSIVRCLGTGDTETGGVYLALEYLDGGSLQDVVDRSGRLPAPQAVGAARAILSGLAVVHARGLVHRDVKPANVLLDGAGHVKLADFGLARPVEGSSALTQTGTVLGTPFYMAPELIRGHDPAPSVDIYAAGATLWTLLVGAPPFPGDNPLKVLQAHLRDPVPDLRAKLPGAPARLVEALDALLAKDPADRPPTAERALALLDGLPTMPVVLGDATATVIAEAVDPGAATTRAAPRPGSSDDAGPRRTSGRTTVAMEALREAERAPPPPRRTSARVTVPMDEPAPPPRPSDRARTTGRQRRPSAAATTQTLAPELPARVDPKPLPPPRRSRWWGRFVGALALLALLHGVDVVLRARSVDGLMVAASTVRSWSTPPGPPPGSWQAAVAPAGPHLERALAHLRRARDWVDLHLAPCFAVVGLLVVERLFARAARYGLVEGLALRRRAARLVRAGEVHQAALVWEDLGDRRRAARLLLDHGMAALAADMLLAAGDIEGARAARALAPAPARPSSGRSPAPRPALPPGSDPRALAREHLDAGRIDEAVEVFLAAGLRYDAADVLEQAGRTEEAIAALEAAWQASPDGRDYWHHLGKKGLLEEARPRLADRLAGLCLQLDRRAEAAAWFERAGAAEEARALFEALGDHRGAARCLLQGVPAEGPLKPGQRERVALAAQALQRAGDPQALDLFVRAERLEEAARCAEALGDHAAAADLYAQAGAPGAAALAAERAGDLARAAALLDEVEDFARAAELYERAGDLESAALAAGRAGDHEREAELLERCGRWVDAAQAFARLGRGEDALRALARVEPGSERWREARAIAGDVHHQAGRHAEAVAAYEEGLPDLVHFREEVGPQLSYAASLEAIGEFDRALLVLSRLDGKEFAPMDLNQRKGRVEQRRAGATPGGPAPRAPSVRVTAPNELIGAQIASYELLRYVGEGSFAWVFEARHLTLGREAAVKVLKPALASGEAPRRFLREGRAVAGLKHPHLIEIYDAGDVDGLYYLALEFVKGPTLKKLIADEAPFPPMRAARIGAGILSGLGAAHRKGIVHRDLKPANVLVGKGMQAKVLDFGLARVFDDAGQSATAGYLGTPRYASPEQARGGEVGEAADQYAAGLVIYEMLTGKLPFESKTSLGYLALHAHEPPRPILEARADVPPVLAEAVMRALEKDPRDRHENVGAFERVLANFLGAAKRPPGPARP